MSRPQTVADLGESRLLELIRERVPRGKSSEALVGDDAAVLDPLPGSRMLLTTDMVVEGIDFDLAYSSGGDIGWKALAINVSDIAAMAGIPRDAVAAIGMPSETPLDLFRGILDGLLDGCAEWGVRLVGGDISESAAIVVSVALTGWCSGAPITRSGAGVGDAICVTGSLGASAGGLAALRAGIGGMSSDVDSAIARYRRPVPRLAEAGVLGDLDITAMIDVSDGLGLDLLRLLDASGVGCSISSAALPVAAGLAEICAVTGGRPTGLALGGGEDQELLLTLPEETVGFARQALVRLGTPLTMLGMVTDGPALMDAEPLDTQEGLGWEHLRNR